jgi:uncharacterized protein (TIGR00255 family)
MRSMTGLGRATAEDEERKVAVFIKTLNGKGLDVSIRANINLYEFEFEVRNKIKEYLQRGTVSVLVQVETKKPKGNVVNPDALVSTFQFFKDLAKRSGFNLSDDMAFYASLRYVEMAEEELEEETKALIIQALTDAVGEVIKSREEEGTKLKEELISRLKVIREHLKNILENKDSILERAKKRVLEKAKELNLPEGNPTVLNEISLILSKMDIEEEVTRFKVHLERFEGLLDAQGEVGRKLEFLLQEMHREINTLGNKMPELSKWVVEIKAEVDRLKQQVANIE